MQGWLGKYSTALGWVRRGLNTLEDCATEEAAIQRSELLAWYANFSVKEGKHHQAIRWCRSAIQSASDSGNKSALAQAYLVLDWALAELGTLEQPENFERALTLYEELDDLPGQSAILNNLGEVANLQGRWSDALTYYERARDAFWRSGNPVRLAFATYNVAEIQMEQGLFPEAEKLFRESWRIWQAAGFRSGICDAKSGIARLLARSGRFDEAAELFDEARADAVAIDAQQQVLEIDTRIIECHLMRGEFESVIGRVEHVLDAAKSLGGVSPQVPALYRLRGYALMILERLVEAREAFLTSLEAARVRHADYEVALTQGALVRLGSIDGVPEAEDKAEANAVLARLGVIAVPVLVLPRAREEAISV